ncbi:MAG: hypothetical protein RSE41_10075 [Clostridia bacterium]
MFYIVPKNTYMGKSVDEIDKIVQKYSSEHLRIYNLTLQRIDSNDNGILYQLDYSESSYSDLGSIMIKFCDLILNSNDNIYLNLYCGNLEIFKKGIPKDYHLLQEKVLDKNINFDDVKKTFEYYLNSIDTSEKTFILTDPYLFTSNLNSDTKNLIKHIIEKSNCSKLIIIADKSHFSKAMFNELTSEITAEVKLYLTEKLFHDRFWMSSSMKGFYTGASLNGIGKSISLIDLMKDEDVKFNINIIKKEFGLTI